MQRVELQWRGPDLEAWQDLRSRADRQAAKVGGGDAFERMAHFIRDVADKGDTERLVSVLSQKLAARALTWLWLTDKSVRKQLLKTQWVDALIAAQQPRMTRVTLLQLAQLYFQLFDQLDDLDRSSDRNLREVLESQLLDQIERLPATRTLVPVADPLLSLKGESDALINLDGPKKLATRLRHEGRELGQFLAEKGLDGFGDGRYGDVCRTHFYLEHLAEIPHGEWDPVLDELLKPEVSHAPYEGDQRIGHAALGILIDRCESDAPEAWQKFILDLAGDPRIASTARNYREWWKPLGEQRIEKVRGWLAKEDLALFLRALEQYGAEAQDPDFERMFPERKRFLEGLFAMGIVRHARLMLGRRTKQTVSKILGDEIKTNFARLGDSAMADKAVIYLDCGDFYLIEGSHNFKLWAYLRHPGDMVVSYDQNEFSHYDLTVRIPGLYKRHHPNHPYKGIVHNGNWHKNLLEFLADNGIQLDIEKVLGEEDYRAYLRKHGMPTSRGGSATVSGEDSRNDMPRGGYVSPSALGKIRQPKRSERVNKFAGLSGQQISILMFFQYNPGARAKECAGELGLNQKFVNQNLYGDLQRYVSQSEAFGWVVKPEYGSSLRSS
ncbi:EH signature domain-containing protein [Guyparkeria hydrothermalis]|uniref:EH signature domain-containing protein n=1 Tax=Guyparkeria hydrothermalis TaxID=923 RepID=UPI0020203551|nr:EH signature domain-containing protein [Guyparkeria hydrothermalis]MCL7744259.1 EH signature domain-containing protein [Guyparkeria hydrothermalis]